MKILFKVFSKHSRFFFCTTMPVVLSLNHSDCHHVALEICNIAKATPILLNWAKVEAPYWKPGGFSASRRCQCLKWGKKYNSESNNAIVHSQRLGHRQRPPYQRSWQSCRGSEQIGGRSRAKYSKGVQEYTRTNRNTLSKSSETTGPVSIYCFTISDVRFLRMSWDHNFGLMRYGEAWRYRRQICEEHFRKEAAKNYHNIISQKVHAMLDR